MINGYYINLNKRKDRNRDMKKIIKTNPFFKNIKRFPAVYNSNGALGCSISHYCVLSILENLDQPYFLVLEDDLKINDELKLCNFISNFNLIKDKKWDVITLNPWGRYLKKHHSQHFKKYKFKRVTDTQTTLGYIIKKEFIPKLKQKVSVSILNLSRNGPEWMYAIDQIWKRLQYRNTFLAFNKRFCIQSPGYSDIENEHVDYHDEHRRKPPTLVWGGCHNSL